MTPTLRSVDRDLYADDGKDAKSRRVTPLDMGPRVDPRPSVESLQGYYGQIKAAMRGAGAGTRDYTNCGRTKRPVESEDGQHKFDSCADASAHFTGNRRRAGHVVRACQGRCRFAGLRWKYQDDKRLWSEIPQIGPRGYRPVPVIGSVS
jgi:hypothetical protein